MLYRSIIVPLDGSPAAEHALPYAYEIARRAGATLHLVYVHTDKDSPIPVKGQPITDENLAFQRHEHARLYLEAIKAYLSEIHADSQILIQVLARSLENMVNESVSTLLAKHIEATNVDLVVMTTHGRGGLARFWLGSVADMLVRLTNVPILFVRPTEDLPDFLHPSMFQQILIPVDGSRLSEQILKPTLALGELLQAEYTLLHVVKPLYPDDNLITHKNIPDIQASQEAQSYLDTITQRLGIEDQPIATRFIFAEKPAAVILDQARRHEHTLIAMATHGLSGVRRLLLGSVADKVLRGAETAVLVYCPPHHPQD
jgi:nucleotide-binding universal stress UspA family protein